MLTEEQITAIAREYAEFTDLSPVDKKNICAICECFLNHILRRYCLVEKAKVIEKFKITERRIQSGSPSIRQRGFLEKARLQSLFPDIAKEVEVASIKQSEQKTN